MVKQITINALTGEVTEVEVADEVSFSTDDLKAQKLGQLSDIYKSTIVLGFVSSATGTPITYGYSQQDQLNYSKWANVFALNPSKESVIIGSVSNGVVTMTRDQFIRFMADAEAYEVGLYQKKADIQQRITNAQSVSDLNAIEIELV